MKVEGKRVMGVVVDGKFIIGDVVVLVMGLWLSCNLLIFFFIIVSGLKVYSIVFLLKDFNVILFYILFFK